MEENKNYKFASGIAVETIENAKSIQRLEDNMILQNIINKNARTSRMLLGMAGMVLTGVVWVVSNVVADLEKRVNVIEGVEKKSETVEG